MTSFFCFKLYYIPGNPQWDRFGFSKSNTTAIAANSQARRSRAALHHNRRGLYRPLSLIGDGAKAIKLETAILEAERRLPMNGRDAVRQAGRCQRLHLYVRLTERVRQLPIEQRKALCEKQKTTVSAPQI